MPYINPLRRDGLEDYSQPPQTAGELNYLVTMAVLGFLAGNPTEYERLNAAVGALECAKQELYRRRIIPFEETKIDENGDVY